MRTHWTQTEMVTREALYMLLKRFMPRHVFVARHEAHKRKQAEEMREYRRKHS